MSAEVCIVDYGIGNLHSVARAVGACGGIATITADPKRVRKAGRLLLPGVGAFKPCADQLRAAGMTEPVLQFAATGKPFLGICVGMQLLFDYSLEYGHHEGLGLIGGHVAPIPTDGAAGPRKVPHIGWRTLNPAHGRSWDGTLLDGLSPAQSSTYFVHSFNCAPEDEADWLAAADHDGYRICAAVQRENITGFQCHPEKSAATGLKILSNFLAS